jgi:hypothetical protein
MTKTTQKKLASLSVPLKTLGLMAHPDAR